jgi:hypothetical protein
MFERFINKTISYYSDTSTGAYVSDTGLVNPPMAMMIEANVQPYSGDLAQKEYGLQADEMLRIYLDDSDRSEKLTVGMICTVDKQNYTVTHVEQYSDDWGKMAILRLRHE